MAEDLERREATCCTMLRQPALVEEVLLESALAVLDVGHPRATKHMEMLDIVPFTAGSPHRQLAVCVLRKCIPLHRVAAIGVGGHLVRPQPRIVVGWLRVPQPAAGAVATDAQEVHAAHDTTVAGAQAHR